MTMVLGIVIGVVCLAAALWIVGRHEAEINLPTVLMIPFGVSVVTGVVGAFIGPVAFGVGFLLAMLAVNKFCYLGLGKSALVALLYFVGRIAAAIAFGELTSS